MILSGASLNTPMAVLTTKFMQSMLNNRLASIHTRFLQLKKLRSKIKWGRGGGGGGTSVFIFFGGWGRGFGPRGGGRKGGGRKIKKRGF